jgi:uncharacterized protein (DUF2267 family)
MLRQRLFRTGMALGGVAAGVALARNPQMRHRARLALRWASRDVHHVEGALRGLGYRLAGNRPDPMAGGMVLADRARSELGRLERHLDVPRLHVSVRRHVATLHGEVRTPSDVAEIEKRVLEVSGIWGVRSFLHVGLSGGDTPPSRGRYAESPSPMLAGMLEQAEEWGLHDHRARNAVHGVLSTLAERLPDGERRHLASHLPSDVRAMLAPVRTCGRAHHRVHDVDEFLSMVAATSGVDEMSVAPVAESVLGTLRERAPEEAADIAAVLPEGLRRWWEVAIP